MSRYITIGTRAVARARGTFFVNTTGTCKCTRRCVRYIYIYIGTKHLLRGLRVLAKPQDGHAYNIRYVHRPTDLCTGMYTRVFSTGSCAPPPYGIMLFACLHHARNARLSAHNVTAAKTGNFRKTPLIAGSSNCSVRTMAESNNSNFRLPIRGHVFSI